MLSLTFFKKIALGIGNGDSSDVTSKSVLNYSLIIVISLHQRSYLCSCVFIFNIGLHVAECAI